MEVDLTNIDLTAKPARNRELAALLRVTPQSVSQMIRDQKIRKGDSLQDWIVSLNNYNAATAAGRAGSLTDNRAKLAHEQALAAQLRNQQIAKQLAPVELMQAVLDDLASKISAQIDSLPSLIKARVPYIEPEDIVLIAEQCNKVRAAMAGIEIKAPGVPIKPTDGAEE